MLERLICTTSRLIKFQTTVRWARVASGRNAQHICVSPHRFQGARFAHVISPKSGDFDRFVPMAENLEEAEAFVRRAVPECNEITFQNQKVMGFSGAMVTEVLCATPDKTLHLFLKVVEPAPLAATASEGERLKWQKNLQSYANEAELLDDQTLQGMLQEKGVVMPNIIRIEKIEHKRYTILADWLGKDHSMYAVHEASRTPEVIGWLARFHSAFHGKVPSNNLWKIGTHVHLAGRPPQEIDRLPKSIADFCDAFSTEDPWFGRPESRVLGERLHAIAEQAASYLRPSELNETRTTIVHGDFKGANYFLKNDGPGCVAIDWQWTGPGIGATDVIYLFCGSVEDAVVDEYMDYLQMYHSALDVPDYPFEEFLRDFKVATLDYTRWMFSVRLVGDTPEKFNKLANNVDVNLGYFRRHHPRVMWLLRLVEEFLPDAENGVLFS